MPYTRSDEIRGLSDRITQVGFTPQEYKAVICVLFERKTHREAAAAEGLTREASMKRLQRARRKARKFGIEIPSGKRRKRETQTLAQFRRRAA